MKCFLPSCTKEGADLLGHAKTAHGAEYAAYLASGGVPMDSPAYGKTVKKGKA